MRAYLAVFIGGLAGTGLRLAIDVALPHEDAEFPVSTLLVNLLGALVLGVLVGGIWRRFQRPLWWKAGIGSGLLGSFTTFSALAASMVTLTEGGAFFPALAYLVVSLVGGLALAAIGLKIGSVRDRLRMPRRITDRGETL